MEHLLEQQTTMVIEQTTKVVPTKVILGAKLRRARESQRLSQIDVARRLRLRLEVIESLERDDFSKLPAAVFVRGYLRSYAKLVHLSEDEIIQLFNRAIESANDKEKQEHAACKSIEKPRQKTFKDLRFLTYAIVAGLVLLVVLWWFGEHKKSSGLMTNKTLTQLQLEEMEQEQQALRAQHILANERIDISTPVTEMLGIAQFDFPYSANKNRFLKSKKRFEATTAEPEVEDVTEIASEEQE